MIICNTFERKNIQLIILECDATVTALIDGDSRWWNKPMLENLFSKEEAHLIQSLPISHSNREDRCIWRGTKNEIFSVRSAYFLLQELEAKRSASSSVKVGPADLWSKLWKLKIPNAEKHFFVEGLQ